MANQTTSSVEVLAATGTETDRQEAFATIVRREKKSRRMVLIADKAADYIITWGGIAVIVAVMGIMVFLVSEVLPLFQSGEITAKHQYKIKLPSSPVVSAGIDDYKTMFLVITQEGGTAVYHAKTGKPLAAPKLDMKGRAITAIAATPDGRNIAFGLDDGTVRFGLLSFQTKIIPADKLPKGLSKVDKRDRTNGAAVYSAIPGHQYRIIKPVLTLEKAVPVSPGGMPIVALAYRVSGEAERQVKAFVAIDRDGVLLLSRAETQVNLLSGQKSTEISTAKLPPLPAGTEVADVLLSDKADKVLVALEKGAVVRYNTADFQKPFLAEVVRVLPKGVNLTTFGFLFGGAMIMVGGGDGSVAAYFLLEKKAAASMDGYTLVKLREYRRGNNAIVGFSPSRRDKSFVVAELGGRLRIIHATSQKLLFDFRPDRPARYQALQLASRLDGILALGGDGVTRLWEFEVPHPETTFKTLFGKVWYEGYQRPGYTWQSSAATDDFEPKLSLIPLIFGTLKATVYSLLFAIPIAILGAIYTSEFVHPKVRSVVKPAMEMMASLPSVVLGFVAALVMAPFVENWIAALILAFLALPIALVAAAYLWQLLPTYLAMRWQGLPKLSIMFAVIALEMWIAWGLGPWFERLFFGGDFKAWVNGGIGSGQPFLFLLLLPLCFMAISYAFNRGFEARIHQVLLKVGRFIASLLDIARWVGFVAGSCLLAWLVSWGLSALGVDARGGFVNTYVQRNTLVVGFTMGFAVIPIIYTIAEDALNAVPEHLRAASLGCGASPWQTAKWVVLPTAVSGVFSAIMIGMGRAVGETMIVVMAAGNTPLLDWNIFNGLRALSATIAVELPEAVKDGTLYRVLFLAGLVLFGMTFIINTLAEVVRQRFRKRTLQL